VMPMGETLPDSHRGADLQEQHHVLRLPHAAPDGKRKLEMAVLVPPPLP
jgi:hypothetical protein